MLYVFAMTEKLSKLLNRIKTADHQHVVNNSIDAYLDILIRDQPSHIIGLGEYSGIDQDKIRIETIATNRFRNGLIETDAPQTIEINKFLTPINEHFKLASAMGNSWCNLISWRIMRLIVCGSLRSYYSFLHIPKNNNRKLPTMKLFNCQIDLHDLTTQNIKDTMRLWP